MTATTYPGLPARLRLLREISGLSREQLARRAISPRAPGNNIGRIERGVHNPTEVTLKKIAFSLGLHPEFFMKGYKHSSGKASTGWSVDDGFPLRLRKLMQEKRLDSAELAANLGWSSQGSNEHIVKLCRGSVCPRPETVRKLALVLEVSAQYLANGTTSDKALDDLTLPERLVLVRKAAKLSRTELAQEAGITDPTGGWRKIAFWEKGRLRPTYQEFVRVAKTLGVSLEWLHNGTYPVGNVPEESHEPFQPQPDLAHRLWTQENNLSQRSQALLEELRALLETGSLTDKEVTELRNLFRQRLVRKINQTNKKAA